MCRLVIGAALAAVLLLPACAAPYEGEYGEYRDHHARGAERRSPPPSSRPRSSVGVGLGVGIGATSVARAAQSDAGSTISLPSSEMSRMFGRQDQFSPSPDELQAIETYVAQLPEQERARLQEDLKKCRAAASCVVTPAPGR